MKKLASLENTLDDKSLLMKRIGIWSFAFFAIKGMLWLLFTVALAWFGMN